MTRTPPPPPTDKAKAALAKYRDSVSAAKRRDIEKAINHLRKTDATINVSTVARRAKVTRKTVLKHDDLMAIIDQYRYRPPTGKSRNRQPAETPASWPHYATRSPPKPPKSTSSKPLWHNTRTPSNYSTDDSKTSSTVTPEHRRQPAAIGHAGCHGRCRDSINPAARVSGRGGRPTLPGVGVLMSSDDCHRRTALRST